jgi:hypothetical protein
VELEAIFLPAGESELTVRQEKVGQIHVFIFRDWYYLVGRANAQEKVGQLHAFAIGFIWR